MEKVYRTKIDLRVLGDEIKFSFFISGNIIGGLNQQQTLKKRHSFNFTYKTIYPVDVIVKVENNIQRTFLYFDELIQSSLNSKFFENTSSIITLK